MPLDPRTARIAANEASFRDINERLERGLRKVPHGPELHPFVCECGHVECQQSVGLTVDEYEAVRRDSRHFAITPGHAILDAESVIARHERYHVVEKNPEAETVSDATDQRRPGPHGLRDEG
jgi:hypothetical protein